MSYQLNGPPPASVGAAADEYAYWRALRLAMEKEVEPVRAREAACREFIIENLSKSEDTGAAGKAYRAQIVSKRKPKIADWGVFTSWVRESGRFDCLQHRLTEKAVMDTMEQEGRTLPGLEVIIVPDVSITKIPNRQR